MRRMSRYVRAPLIWAVVFMAAGAGIRFVPGMRFSSYLCAGIAGLCVLTALLCLWSEHFRAGWIALQIYRSVLILGMIYFAGLEFFIVRAGEANNADTPVQAAIVLGAGVNGTTPSLALSTRIDAAAAYLKAHPDIPAVLSGGRGPGEDITEARAMYTALMAAGIASDRLLLEQDSTSTEENFADSKALLQDCGVNTDTATVAVVSNDFHLFRAGILAKREGLTTVGVPAELPWWWLTVNYYAREAFAVTALTILG